MILTCLSNLKILIEKQIKNMIVNNCEINYDLIDEFIKDAHEELIQDYYYRQDNEGSTENDMLINILINQLKNNELFNKINNFPILCEKLEQLLYNNIIENNNKLDNIVFKYDIVIINFVQSLSNIKNDKELIDNIYNKYEFNKYKTKMINTCYDNDFDKTLDKINKSNPNVILLFNINGLRFLFNKDNCSEYMNKPVFDLDNKIKSIPLVATYSPYYVSTRGTEYAKQILDNGIRFAVKINNFLFHK